MVNSPDLKPFPARPAGGRAARGKRPGSRGSAGGRRRRPWLDSGLRLWRRARGSTLVQTMLVVVAALAGALLLASRMMASRFASVSRSDTLSAREAAEYGLNELQSQLNSKEYGYLWVTNRASWGSVDVATLKSCRIPAFNASGNEMSDGTPPRLTAGVTADRDIRNNAAGKVSYRLVEFTPPRLPDNSATTLAQSDFCGSGNAGAANFGNLSGGSALITVEGKVERDGTTSTFRMRRSSHVRNPITEMAYSFIILGDAYESSAGTFGAKADITRLLAADGNICYGNLGDSTCFTNPAKPKTIIGCFELASCLINNVDFIDAKQRATYCQDLKAKDKGGKKKKRGTTCNDFQQIGDLPPMITPTSSGVIINSTQYNDSHWNGGSTKIDLCEAINYGTSKAPDWGWRCDFKEIRNFNADGTERSKQGDQNDVRTNFPYRKTGFDKITSTASVASLTNADLVPGCYFNNISINNTTSTAGSANSTAINCLTRDIKIDNKGASDPGVADFMIYTTKQLAGGGLAVLPTVNVFFHGTDEILLEKGGIANSDSRDLGWSRLRLLGKAFTTAPNTSVACNKSSNIKSKKGNDLNNLFVWLPNASLLYDRKASTDNAYAVIWTCEFTGPASDKGNKYSIITPLPEQVVRAGLADSVPGFVQNAAASYRAFGSRDTPL